MKWYLNDASLQGQFSGTEEFGIFVRDLISLRARIPIIRSNFRTTRSFPEASVSNALNVRTAIMSLKDRDLKSVALIWLDRTGPFVDDDRAAEEEDYFEYNLLDVTDTGLGEAARRTKSGSPCSAFSFPGGRLDFAIRPLEVDHGMAEARLGTYSVENCWSVDQFSQQALGLDPLPTTWASLFDVARKRFPHLTIGPLESHPNLAKEPFAASIRDRALELFSILNDYVENRGDGGVELSKARTIVETYFVGDENAIFTGESSTNRSDFKTEMTFRRADNDEKYFAHWHGKIKHRFFRMHFEWPLDGNQKKLEVFYLGPKLTKT